MNRLQAMGLSPWYVPEAGLRHFVPAAKCSLDHMVARAEASAFDHASSYTPEEGRLLVGGVPLVLFKSALGQLLRAARGRFIGGGAHLPHYVRFRKQIALIKALRQRRLSGGRL
jgi:hypothetical protein